VGLKKKRLEQELEVTLVEEDRAALEGYAATLPVVVAAVGRAKAEAE
jgi:hypothetical protein